MEFTPTQPHPLFRDYYDRIFRELAASLNVPRSVLGKYQNPFSILRQFDQWYEFTLRTTGGESSGDVITDMLDAGHEQYLETRYSSLT